MWVMLDEISFYMFLGFTAAFFVLLVVTLIIFLKMPPAAKAVIGSWLKKKILVIDSDDSGLLVFKGFKKGGDEGQIERKDKRGYTEVKIIPRHSNPIVAVSYHLEKTGIPAFLSYSGKAVVATPQMLAATRVSQTDGKFIPKEVKEWAKKQNISFEYLTKVREGDKEVVKQKTFKKDLFTIEPRDLKQFYDGTYDEGQYKVRLKQEYQRGYRDRGSQFTKFAIPLGIILIGVIVFIFLMSGGLKGFGF